MDEKQVRDFLDDYAAVLSAADARAMASRWNVPSLVVAEGRTIAVNHAEETEAFFTQSFAQYHSAGIRTAVPSEPRITVLSDSVAAVRIHWIHEDGSGHTVGGERAFYVLARDPESGVLKVVFYTPESG